MIQTSPKTKPLYRYVARLKNGLTPNKDEVRARTIRFVHAYLRRIPIDRPSMLSLPSSWWITEKNLRNLGDGRFLKMKFTACERDKKLFRLAAVRIPKANKHIKQKYNRELDCEVVTNGKDFVLLNTDIFDFIAVTDKAFDVVWLDTTTPITYLYQGLWNLRRVLRPRAIVILNVMKGREHVPIEESRHEHIVDFVCVAGRLDYVRCDEYRDTTPMMQFIFTKKV